MGSLLHQDSKRKLTFGSGSHSSSFIGALDEISVWKSALSREDVFNLYQSQVSDSKWSYFSPVQDGGEAKQWSRLSWKWVDLIKEHPSLGRGFEELKKGEDVIDELIKSNHFSYLVKIGPSQHLTSVPKSEVKQRLDLINSNSNSKFYYSNQGQFIFSFENNKIPLSFQSKTHPLDFKEVLLIKDQKYELYVDGEFEILSPSESKKEEFEPSVKNEKDLHYVSSSLSWNRALTRWERAELGERLHAMKVQARSCDQNPCNEFKERWVDAEVDPLQETLNLDLPIRRYFQYGLIFDNQPLIRLSEMKLFQKTYPKVGQLEASLFLKWDDIEKLEAHLGSCKEGIGLQISSNKKDWYFWDEKWLKAGAQESNTVSETNTHLSEFKSDPELKKSLPQNGIFFRLFMKSNGFTPCEFQGLTLFGS